MVWNILTSSIIAANPDNFKSVIHQSFINGDMRIVAPRGDYDRPRYGSTSSAAMIGPVY